MLKPNSWGDDNTLNILSLHWQARMTVVHGMFSNNFSKQPDVLFYSKCCLYFQSSRWQGRRKVTSWWTSGRRDTGPWTTSWETPTLSCSTTQSTTTTRAVSSYSNRSALMAIVQYTNAGYHFQSATTEQGFWPRLNWCTWRISTRMTMTQTLTPTGLSVR